MESTIRNKTWFPLSLLLFPFILIFLFFFSIHSWRNRFGYKGNKDYLSRYFFFQKIHLILSQLFYKTEILESYNLLTRKDVYVFIYSKKINWALLSLPFLLSSYYKKIYQKVRDFKLCLLSESKPRWWWLLSSLDTLLNMPDAKYLKEFECPIVCFSSSISQLKELALKSYKTIVFFKFESYFSFKKGFVNTFRAIGKLSSNELLKSTSKSELKLNELLTHF